MQNNYSTGCKGSIPCAPYLFALTNIWMPLACHQVHSLKLQGLKPKRLKEAAAGLRFRRQGKKPDPPTPRAPLYSPINI
jgi:hypothetical protein